MESGKRGKVTGRCLQRASLHVRCGLAHCLEAAHPELRCGPF